jgi:hypothetical protein
MLSDFAAVGVYEDQGRTWKMYIFGTYCFTTLGLFKIILFYIVDGC